MSTATPFQRLNATLGCRCCPINKDEQEKDSPRTRSCNLPRRHLNLHEPQFTRPGRIWNGLQLRADSSASPCATPISPQGGALPTLRHRVMTHSTSPDPASHRGGPSPVSALLSGIIMGFVDVAATRSWGCMPPSSEAGENGLHIQVAAQQAIGVRPSAALLATRNGDAVYTAAKWRPPRATTFK